MPIRKFTQEYSQSSLESIWTRDRTNLLKILAAKSSGLQILIALSFLSDISCITVYLLTSGLFVLVIFIFLAFQAYLSDRANGSCY